ncbi:MAG TPA: mechanosensitive ion channel domain-containing protein [Gammaproteobacteria bacterium]|nr:mechanosensitive ion channel domain-containing protein [Gammaproteobacteria bacterium]
MDDLAATISKWLNPQLIGETLLTWSGKVLAAAAIFLIGRFVARLLAEWFSRAVQRVGIDQTLARFFASLIYIGVLVYVAVTAVGTLGVDTLNFVALLGAAGLAVGLALKDSLSNFSSGVMLVFFRPFQVGDTITAAGVTGVVDTIGMFSTVIKTPDNVVITVPNSLVYGGTIQNFTAERTRRTEFVVWTSYDGSTADALNVIRDLASGDKRVLTAPAPEVVVHELGPNGVCIAVRLWAANAELGAVRSDMLESVKTALEQRGFSIPYQRMRVEQLAGGK